MPKGIKGFPKGNIPWIKGKNHSKETREKISKAKLGNKDGFKKGNTPWTKNRKLTKEHKEKIAKSCRGIEFTEEHIKKISGIHNGNWNGGITSKNHKIRYSKKSKSWRKFIFERDDYTCQICNKRGGELHIHHIKSFKDYPELRFDLNNGITLCKKCHRELHKNRKAA